MDEELSEEAAEEEAVEEEVVLISDEEAEALGEAEVIFPMRSWFLMRMFLTSCFWGRMSVRRSLALMPGRTVS